MISVAPEDLLLRVLGLPPSPLPRGDSTFRCSCSVHEGPSTPVCVSPQTSPNPAGKVRKACFTYLEESLRRPCQAQKLPPTLMGSPGWRPHPASLLSKEWNSGQTYWEKNVTTHQPIPATSPVFLLTLSPSDFFLILMPVPQFCFM